MPRLLLQPTRRSTSDVSTQCHANSPLSNDWITQDQGLTSRPYQANPMNYSRRLSERFHAAKTLGWLFVLRHDYAAMTLPLGLELAATITETTVSWRYLNGNLDRTRTFRRIVLSIWRFLDCDGMSALARRDVIYQILRRMPKRARGFSFQRRQVAAVDRDPSLVLQSDAIAVCTQNVRSDAIVRMAMFERHAL